MLGAEAGEEGGGAKQSRQEVKEAEKPQAVEVEEQEGPEEEAGVWHTGVCKWFNPSKGWGFINLTEIQVKSKESELTEADSHPTVSEAATVEKKKVGQKDIEKYHESEVDEELPSGDIFVHQSTIQKEGFR